MNEELVERVRASVNLIPPGSVATYGDIAVLTGAPSPRVVGRVLAEDGADLEWQRVVKADGSCAPHLREEQLRRLAAEGVPAPGGRVDLRKYRWEEVAR